MSQRRYRNTKTNLFGTVNPTAEFTLDGHELYVEWTIRFLGHGNEIAT